MIPGLEFFNTKQTIDRHEIYRVCIKDYLVLIELMDRIRVSKSRYQIIRYQKEIIRLCSNVRFPRKRHMGLYPKIMKFNIPATDTGKKKTNSKRTELYRNILILVDIVLSQYASLNVSQIFTEMNIFQLLIFKDLITRRQGLEYMELTSITGLSQYKPNILFERYGKWANSKSVSPSTISTMEAFRLSDKAREKGHAEFH